jgi:phosphoribosylanthranilate isomerase
MKPYIGVTGFKTTNEVDAVTCTAEELGYPASHTIMFGYLTSSKRLQSPDIPGMRGPSVDSLPALVARAPAWSLPMLHYHTKDHEKMRTEVDRLISLTGVPSVQLNMDWPSLEDIAALTRQYSGLAVVLQFPARAMQGMSIEHIAERASEYDGLVAYALIDKSGGKGIPFDASETADILAALEIAMPRTTLAVAGGFSPDNVAERIRQLRANRPYSIDAESGVMTNNALDIEKVRLYIANSMEAVK